MRELAPPVWVDSAVHRPVLAALQYPPYNLPSSHLQHPIASHLSFSLILTPGNDADQWKQLVHDEQAVLISYEGTFSRGRMPTPPQGTVHFLREANWRYAGLSSVAGL